VHYPTTDLQLIAQVLRRTIDGDVVPVAEKERLDQIAEKGFSAPHPPTLEGEGV
jgi:hypothetical protein